MNSTFLCTSCGMQHSVRTRTTFRDQELCPACLESFTRICAHCGERIWTEDNVGTHETPLCEPCFERYLYHCSRYGRLLRNEGAYYENEEDDRSLCDSCCSTVFSSWAIHDYYYRPEPVFYGNGPRYMGVELEVDGAGEDISNAREVLSTANRARDLLYCKLEEGFELVTHPMDGKFIGFQGEQGCFLFDAFEHANQSVWIRLIRVLTPNQKVIKGSFSQHSNDGGSENFLWSLSGEMLDLQ